ncbi:gp26 family baseplate hub assembly chaperone, partial [Salmonella enterica]
NMNYDYKFEVQINGSDIQCRAFTLEEYKELIDGKINGNIDEVVKRLINNCTSTRNLNKQESELLLIQLWS